MMLVPQLPCKLLTAWRMIPSLPATIAAVTVTSASVRSATWMGSTLALTALLLVTSVALVVL